jgi:hypothetical protein
MPVMVTADVSGQTPEGYDAVLNHLSAIMKNSPGFVLHTAHAVEGGGWRVIEIWQSRNDANQFFSQHVHPNLPPGMKPRRSFQDLHSLVVIG